MLICLDEVFVIKEEEHEPELRAHVAYKGPLYLSMRTSSFQIEMKDGKATINLTRHLTPEQIRQIGEKFIKVADDIDNELVMCPKCNQRGTIYNSMICGWVDLMGYDQHKVCGLPHNHPDYIPHNNEYTEEKCILCDGKGFVTPGASQMYLESQK